MNFNRGAFVSIGAPHWFGKVLASPGTGCDLGGDTTRCSIGAVNLSEDVDCCDAAATEVATEPPPQSPPPSGAHVIQGINLS
jgi:hypothetical protein